MKLLIGTYLKLGEVPDYRSGETSALLNLPGGKQLFIRVVDAAIAFEIEEEKP